MSLANVSCSGEHSELSQIFKADLTTKIVDGWKLFNIFSKTSKAELTTKIVNGWKLFNIFAKSSIFDWVVNVPLTLLNILRIILKTKLLIFSSFASSLSAKGWPLGLRWANCESMSSCVLRYNSWGKAITYVLRYHSWGKAESLGNLQGNKVDFLNELPHVITT